MAKAKGDDELFVSQAAYARHRKVDRSYISRLVKKGRLKLYNGKINKAEADLELDKNGDPSRELAAESADDVEENIDEDASNNSPTFRDHKTKHAEYQAEILRIKIAKEKKELVPVSEVKSQIKTAFIDLRQRLQILPSRIAGKLCGMSDEREIASFIEEEVNETLLRISDELSAKLGSIESGE